MPLNTAVELPDSDRAELARWLRSPSMPAGLVQRARIVLLAATEKLLAPLIARVQAGKLTGAAEIGIEVGKVISKYKTGKHFEITITDTTLAAELRQAQI